MAQDSIRESLKEYGRGIAGGLLFSLPLLYTMEVWWRGFSASPLDHFVLVIATYLLLLGYNSFAGIRKNLSFKGVCWDSVEEMGLAFFVSFSFLFMIGKVSFEMSLYEAAGKVIVESMIVAIGISVGTKQLGQQNKRGKGKQGNKEKNDAKMLEVFILGICGAILFSSSVAPTLEILKIGVESEAVNLLIMVLVTLILSTLIMFFIDFVKAQKKEGMIMFLHIVITYAAALISSAFLLWYFGRFEERNFSIILAQIIVLSIPGGLGASAGRLLIGK